MKIDVLKRRLEEVGRILEELDPALNGYDNAFREIRKIARILASDEYFVKLDKLGVLSDDESGSDNGRPFEALQICINKIEKLDPLMLLTEIYSRIYGVILALEEYDKYSGR
ncbi:MAG: hypothetical protein K2M04_03385 [Muribaculaceae bacterium]|nr:hypothetical protein [Muribaculaceae bacterium]